MIHIVERHGDGVSTGAFSLLVCFPAFATSSLRRGKIQKGFDGIASNWGLWPALRKQFRSSLRIYSETPFAHMMAHWWEMIRRRYFAMIPNVRIEGYRFEYVWENPFSCGGTNNETNFRPITICISYCICILSGDTIFFVHT